MNAADKVEIFALMRCALQEGRNADALEMALQQLQHETNNPTLYKMLALAHSGLGQYELAITNFFSALELMPQATLPQETSCYLNIATLIARLVIIEQKPEQDITGYLCKFRRSLFNNYPHMALREDFIHALLTSFKFLSTGVSSFKQQIFSELVIPLLHYLLERGDIASALATEGIAIQYFVYQKEEQAHFRHCVSLWAEKMEQFGRHVAANIIEKNRDPYDQAVTTVLKPKPRVAFFIHRESTLAHNINVIATLQSYVQLSHQPYELMVYAFDGDDILFQERLASCGVRLINLAKLYPNSNSYSRILRLRESLFEERVDLLVWICLAFMLPFAFGLRLAPKQVWWSMKYDGLQLDSIDRYLYINIVSDAQRKGPHWQVVKTGNFDFVGDFDNNCVQAKPIRANFAGFQLLLGTFGRAEKLRDPRFLDCVVQILKLHTHVAFLWSSKTQDEDIQTFFTRHGVEQQCFYVGWVDTQIYAHVIDIFLDSFPFKCGHTLLEAMAIGRASITLIDPSAEILPAASFHQDIIEIYQEKRGDRSDYQKALKILGDKDAGGESSCALFAAKDCTEYVARANLLIEDTRLRQRCGAINRAIVAEFFTDKTRIGSSFVEAIKDLIV